MARSISETAVVIAGPLGREGRQIFRKLGHSVGRVASIEATTALGRPFLMKLISTVVVREERNEGMNGMNSPVTSHNWRIFMCGNKGLLMTQSCRTESTSERGRYRMAHSSSFRILWAYFRKRAHSNVVGNLSKDFQIEQSRKGVLLAHSQYIRRRSRHLLATTWVTGVVDSGSPTTHLIPSLQSSFGSMLVQRQRPWRLIQQARKR